MGIITQVIAKIVYLKTGGAEASSPAYVDLTVVVMASASMAREQARLNVGFLIHTLTLLFERFCVLGGKT